MTIFIVDDDLDDIALLKEALGINKYRGFCEVCQDGQELMDRLSESGAVPALIILDLNMPLKNGYQTLREIRSDHRFKDIPVVILTTSSNERDRSQCEVLGCNGFYCKPWSVCGYAGIVKDLLSNITEGNG